MSGCRRRDRVKFGAIALGALVCAVVSSAAAGKLPAFPGAEGFGAYAVGGRGGRVIEVTNLNTSGPGSLRAACRAKGPRIVVFRVSGIIDDGVVLRNPFITIAGQTAPGDGICVRGTIWVFAHDVIIRYLRARPGDTPFGATPDNRACITVHADNVIVDHCSASWGLDQNINIGGEARNVTYQWCITSESLHDSFHHKGPHSKATLFGYKDNAFSVHHCLLAHNDARNPLFSDKRPGTVERPSIHDFRNSVIYNHGRSACSVISGPISLNYVGNFIKLGPNGLKNSPRGIRISGRHPQTRIFVQDNIWPQKPEGKVDDWGVVGGAGVVGPNRIPVPETFRLRKPAKTPSVTIQPPAQAYESVLRFGGCTRPVRDVVDARIVAEVRAGTGHIIDSQKDVGAWPTYASARPPADSDHDAMPDAWEKRFGLNPNDPADGPKDRDGDGYTNVEEFLNETDPTKRDSGAPLPQRPVLVQTGNAHIRGGNARKIGEQRLAKLKTVAATKESRKTLLRKVRESGKEVADYLGIKFVRIHPGSSMVYKCKVTLTKPFELSACEITQAQWQAVMGTRPWAGELAAKDDPQHPATYVSYLDCQEFIRRLNACGGREYRLPTSYEWRYAARAGTNFPCGFRGGIQAVPDYAWCCINGPDRQGRHVLKLRTTPQAVGRLKPNPWGLCDVGGNAREWCHEWYGYFYHDARPGPGKTDPMGPKKTRWHTYRRTCGGHFRMFRRRAGFGRAGNHYPHYRGFDMGFRLYRAAP